MLYALDFETGGLEMWRDDVPVKCMALSWRHNGEIVSKFFDGMDAMRQGLQTLVNQKATVLVYNVGFEALVLQAKFPDIPLLTECKIIDVLRLTQLWDTSQMSWGLKAAVARLLPQNAGYEDKIYQKLVTQLPEYLEKVKRKAKALIKEQPELALEHRERVAIEHVAKQNKSKLGAFLIAADGATLREYNVLDAELTLQLYEEYCKGFTLQNFDWKHDHTLYLNSGLHIARSIGQGIFVDVPRLQAHIAERETLVTKCIQKFETTYKTELAAWKQLHNTTEFNIHSGKQLQSFVCDFMKVPPKFFTGKGSPSFKDEHLPTYGVIGELIRGSIEIATDSGTKTVPRATVELSLKQAKSLLALSESDSKWHFSMRLTGTVSGRYTTGGEI